MRAQLLRQTCDQLFKQRANLNAEDFFVCRRIERCDLRRRWIGSIEWYLDSASVPAAVIDRDSPGNARQPALWIFDGRELRAIPQDAHKGFLCGVLGILMPMQDRKR